MLDKSLNHMILDLFFKFNMKSAFVLFFMINSFSTHNIVDKLINSIFDKHFSLLLLHRVNRLIWGDFYVLYGLSIPNNSYVFISVTNHMLV